MFDSFLFSFLAGHLALRWGLVYAWHWSSYSCDEAVLRQLPAGRVPVVLHDFLDSVSFLCNVVSGLSSFLCGCAS